VLEAYRAHVQERAELGIPPKPLDPEWTAQLVELLKSPPAGEEEFLLDLIANRVPPGVDEAAYVKAGFLSAIVTGDASSPLIDAAAAVKLLGNMHGGYNVATLVSLLDDETLAASAAEELKSTILVFDAFHDVAAKADAGNAHAKGVMQSWADAEWFTTNDSVPESIQAVVFKVTGETNTDDLSPAQDAWSRPDIPLHARAMYKMQREGLTPEVQGEVGPMEQIKALQDGGVQVAFQRGRGRKIDQHIAAVRQPGNILALVDRSGERVSAFLDSGRDGLPHAPVAPDNSDCRHCSPVVARA